MNHKNMTAAEVAASYLKELKNIERMRYLTFGVFLLLLYFLRDRIGLLMCVVFVAVLYLALKFLHSLYVQQFQLLTRMLDEDCDAEKYAEVMGIVQASSKKEPAVLKLCWANGLYHAGRFPEAAEALDQVYFKQAGINTRMLFQQLLFFCRLNTEGMDAACQIREDTRQLAAQCKGPQLTVAERTLRVMDAALALAAGDWDTFYPLEEQIQSEAATHLQLVSSAFRMGKADLAAGRTESAREHLEDVVAEGGTLYVAKEANVLLASMEPAQLSAPKED